MGLSDLIRKVHGSDVLSVLLDQHVLFREKEAPPRAFGWHPSGFVGMCARQAVLERLVVTAKERDSFGAQLLRIFDVGSALHAWYQNNYFGEMGILWGKWECLRCDAIRWGTRPIGPACPECKKSARWNYLEVPLRARLGDTIKKCIVGHSDGIIQVQGRWYVLEIKTILEDGFTWQKKASPKHVQQAQVYGELIRQGKVWFDGYEGDRTVPEVLGIIILYINKNRSVEREYRLDFDQDGARAEIKKPYLVEMAFQHKEFPARCGECVNMLQNPAKKCPMVTYCFGGKSWTQLEN